MSEPIDLSGKWIGTFTLNELTHRGRVKQITPRMWRLINRLQPRFARRRKR